MRTTDWLTAAPTALSKVTKIRKAQWRGAILTSLPVTDAQRRRAGQGPCRRAERGDDLIWPKANAGLQGHFEIRGSLAMRLSRIANAVMSSSDIAMDAASSALASAEKDLARFPLASFRVADNLSRIVASAATPFLGNIMARTDGSMTMLGSLGRKTWD